MTRLLLGNPVAEALNEKSRLLIEQCREKGISPTLALARIGEREDDLSYERTVLKRCEKLAIETRSVVLPLDCTNEQLQNCLKELNEDDGVHSILMFRPLPKHLDEKTACNLIAFEKDCDAANDTSLAKVFLNQKDGFAPCTPEAVMEMLHFYEIPVEEKHVCVLGRSNVVGKPLSMLLLQENATVTICHSRTADLKQFTKKADIVISAMGKPEMLDMSCFHEHSIILDVGMTWSEEKQKLCGDVDFDQVKEHVEAITPVPKGVGSVTTSVLLHHVAMAAVRKL